MSDDIRELTEEDFARAIPRKQRERIMRGELEGSAGVVVLIYYFRKSSRGATISKVVDQMLILRAPPALGNFTGLTQKAFADALGISVHTLRNWEQDRRVPEGPALAVLRIAARHPRVLRENLAVSA